MECMEILSFMADTYRDIAARTYEGRAGALDIEARCMHALLNFPDLPQNCMVENLRQERAESPPYKVEIETHIPIFGETTITKLHDNKDCSAARCPIGLT